MIRYSLLALHIIFWNCDYPGSFQKKDFARENITAVNLTFNLPITNTDGSVTNWKDSFQIYYYKNLTMYKFHYTFDSTFTDSMGKESIILTGERRYNFFVFSNDSAYGYDYAPYRRNSPEILLVDSVLNKQGFGNINLYQVFQKNSLRRISSKPDLDSGIFHEIYVPAPNRDKEMSDNDTCYFSFSNKLNNIKFSLSKELDSLNKMKLFRARLVSNNDFSKEYNIKIARREVFFELKEIPVANTNRLIEFFRTRNKMLLK